MTVAALRKFSYKGLSGNSYRLMPVLGPWQAKFIQLVRTIQGSETNLQKVLGDEADRLEKGLQQAGKDAIPPQQLSYAFLVSLLADVVACEGSVKVYDSEIQLSWPDWHGEAGREVTRRALEASVSHKGSAVRKLDACRRYFLPTCNKEGLLRFMETGEFWLEEGDSDRRVSRGGPSYSDLFDVAVGYWSMPYRGRQGRSRRFVVMGRCESVYQGPVVVGIAELGDDGPFNTTRDEFLGLTTQAVSEWIVSGSLAKRDYNKIADRFLSMRQALLPFDKEIKHRVLSADQVLRISDRVESFATGRSKISEQFMEKKRAAYMVRLAKGEFAFRHLAEGDQVGAVANELKEGVRAIHDVTIPRIHMDVSVCGSVPPFSTALGGKLVIAFLSHPNVIATSTGSKNSVLEQSFDVEKLQSLLPDFGILALTTKGLYPGHSSMYNRASLPGVESTLPLHKIGETVGTTTTLLSVRTSRLAKRLQAQLITNPVSYAYGSGGAKRQRSIESTLSSIGLPEAIAHAGIRRPVYGVRLVNNLNEIVWLCDKPSWLIDRRASGSAVAARCATAWRTKWLNAARTRLSRTGAPLDGLAELLVRTV